MIQKILIQQEKLIPEYQNKWLNIGVSSFLDYKNTNIISNLYTLIGLNKPNYIFFHSPYQAIKGIAKTDELRNSLGKGIIDLFDISWILLQAKIEKQIEEKLLSYLAKELSFKLGNFFTDSLLLPFWDLLEEKLEIELGNEWEILSNVLWYDKILNPQNEFEPSVAEIYNCFSSWSKISRACLCDFCISVLGCEHNSRDWEIFKILISNYGWIFPYENVCLISNRPSIIRLDEQNNLHGEGVPAIQFADSFSVYANHGTILFKE